MASPAMDEKSRNEEWLANKLYVELWQEKFASLGVQSAADYFELIRQEYPNNVAIEFVDREEVLTYQELDVRSNQLANWALEAGIKPYSVVALMMPNCPQFIVTWLGLAKIGVTIACINTRLVGNPLLHALRAAAAKHFIICVSLKDQWQTSVSETREELPPVFWANGPVPKDFEDDQSLMQFLEWPKTALEKSIRSELTLDDPLFYIYTSGTTGPSKAALFSQRRFIGAGLTWSQPMRLTSADKYYVTLPLYHGNGGVVAVSAVWKTGGTVVLRSKFSASQFWKDVQKHKCTAMIYIGELWRYLCNMPPSPEEKDSPLRVIAGNGLRPDIWPLVVSRFGVKKVVEHYGLTEMPAGPYMNCYDKVGACGYIPPSVREKTGADKLVKLNLETGRPERGQDGFAIEVVKPGEVGETVFLLSKPYNGYTNKDATERRIYRDLFKKGDAWFATGDLLKRDEEGFFYFVDRTGDTFRWKGENVSTTEVSEFMTSFPGILEASVYGVEYPHRDGRAGMASVLVGTNFRVEDLHQYVQTLPNYAQPLFLRIRATENAKTTTFKFQKFQYQQEGFDPRKVGEGDLVFFRDDDRKNYVPLTVELYEKITEKSFRV